MRIVFFANHFLPRLGGVELSVHCTASALAARGHDVTVVTETPAAPGPEVAPPGGGYRVRRFSVRVLRPFTRFRYWRALWGMRALLRQADVLHFHDYTPFFHWYLPLRGVIRGPLYAVTFHGFEGFPIRGRHRLFRAVTARLCDLRFAVGTYVAGLYRHPVDHTYIGGPVWIADPAEGAADIDVGFVGRFAEDTGILETMESLAEAARASGRRPTVRLCGDGPLRDALQRAGEGALDLRIESGPVAPSEVFLRSRVVVATGFLSMLDALAGGRAVLVPALDALKRAYVDSMPGLRAAALVAETRSDLARAWTQLLDAHADETAEQLRAMSARSLVSEHTWGNIARMLELRYDDAIAARRARMRRSAGEGRA